MEIYLCMVYLHLLPRVNLHFEAYKTKTLFANFFAHPVMVSDTLAPLYTVFGLKLGCSGAAAPIGDEVL